MKKLSISIYILVGALGACVLGGFLVWFMHTSITETGKEITTLIGKVEEAKAKEDRLQSARAIIDETQSARAELDAHFVTEANVPDFFSFLEQLGAATGAKAEISNVSVVKNEDKEKVSVLERIKFDLNVEGSFGDITHTIALVEAMPYDIVIDQVALNNAGGGWEARLVGSVAKHK